MPVPDRSYDPRQLIVDVQEMLGVSGEPDDPGKAYLAAGLLLKHIGIQPAPAAGDRSAEAMAIREMQLEDATRTTTRGRRVL